MHLLAVGTNYSVGLEMIRGGLISFILVIQVIVRRIAADDEAAHDEKLLVMTNILYRHGDRSPLGSYPSDPIKPSVWPGGLGQLTQKGMTQQHSLGRYFRQRYIQGDPYRLLSPYYTHTLIRVRSTDVDRTLMSAYCNLAGMFPPQGWQRWSESIDWQPIPVHTMQQNTDIFLVQVPCPRYNDLLAEFLQSDVIQDEERRLANFYEFVDNVTGAAEHQTIASILIIADVLYCERQHGLRLPAWADTDWNGTTVYDKLQQLKELALEILYDQPELARLRGGPILGELIDNMMSKINGSTTRNAFIYSAHDSTLIALLSALKVFNHLTPPYCSAVLLELFRTIDDRYFVELQYRNDTTTDPSLLTIPGCKSSCPLDQFITLTRDIIPTNLTAECRTTASSHVRRRSYNDAGGIEAFYSFLRRRLQSTTL